ncbi:hypothetical protein ACT2R3_004124 [Enterobacter hormaechei]
MATTPTNLPVPSESPRDLKFNAGKIDEFVTSKNHAYVDRFGDRHRTITGINYDANQAILGYGYITKKSFEIGATVDNINTALQWESNGEFYWWDGALPKVVPAGSTPNSTGGIGEGKWVSVGDASLRTELSRGQYREDATSCFYVPGFVVDQTTDNRNAAYAFQGVIYIPEDVTVRCNFLPEDDVRKFIGEGKILTRDPWGFDHEFDVSKSCKGSLFTVRGVIHQCMEKKGAQQVSIGVIGDSITDGAWGKQTWTINPNSGGTERNLSSTNYNHSDNGGSHSWFAHFVYTLNMTISRWTSNPAFKGYNCAKSGAKLTDGWGYRNFDYGFFQNAAYGNTAPDTLLISMGWNDVDGVNFESYLDNFDALIRKSWGYGCSVGLVTCNMNDSSRSGLEGAIKRTLASKYPGVEYFDLGTYLRKRGSSDLRNLKNYYVKSDGTFDYTHPQPLGQADMGNAMLWEVCKDTFIPSVKPGEMVSWANADKFWDCVGASSGTHYQFTWENAAGTPALNKMSKVAQATVSSENVTLSTFIFCEEDDMSLFLLEPYTRDSDFTAAGRNHIINVRSPAGKDMAEAEPENLRRLHNSQRLASGVLGEKKTLTTYIGRLRYGINYISVRYDGSPNLVYVPALITGKMNQTKVSINNLRLAKQAGFSGTLIERVNALDGITSNLFDGSQYASLPNWFSAGQNLAGSLLINEPLSDQTGMILFYDPDEKNGYAIQRNGAVLRVGEMVSGVVSTWTNTTVDATKVFQVYFYQTVSPINGASMNIVGTNTYSAFYKKPGGVLGVMNASSSSATFNVTYNAYDMGS